MNNHDFIARLKEWSSQKHELPKYPGATRILSATKDMEGLAAWRQKVGDQEAERILVESQNIGTSLDKLVEDHFNIPGFVDTVKQSPRSSEIGYSLYESMQPQLRRIVSGGTQVPVWSDKLKIKGFIDIAGLFDSTPTVIDIKNSRKPKRAEWIEDYFLQTTMYALACHDSIGVDIKQVAIIMGVRPGEKHPQEVQVFVEPIRKYASKAITRIKEYHANNDYLKQKEIE